MTLADGGRVLRAVLWDMDGTLVDTEPYWIAREHEIVDQYGNGAWNHEHGLALVGRDLRDSAAYMREHGELPLAWRLRKFFKLNYPGFNAGVNRLRARLKGRA